MTSATLTASSTIDTRASILARIAKLALSLKAPAPSRADDSAWTYGARGM